jgi:predicted O-linked N-acetylglucosamine transferase (SPINDLY family)
LQSLPSTLAQQRQATAGYFRRMIDTPQQEHLPPRLRGDKIRVGYFSADFGNHAVARSIAELFEKHDKSQFEIHGFLIAPRPEDDMQRRVRAAFDKFIDVSAASDHAVVQMAREMKIDIAIDLMGYTTDCRPGIFALRAAAIQISYLGYPGTMGVDCIDYIFADRVVIPQEHRRHYSEHVCYLPHSYQANDSQRLISDKVFTRQELKLPDNGFVFCCFNMNYKITPDVFDSWMRILKRVPGSVLWLYAVNETAKKNLFKEAGARGIAPERIVFAAFADFPEHMSRHRAADLFLDTFYYGGHGTASHALWAGLPVLTKLGDTFAGRVGASLLTALNLPELITTSTQDYEQLAIQLATQPKKMAGLRRRLDENRHRSPLFDTARFARNVETAYRAMLAIYEAGKPPEDISIVESPAPPGS